MQECFSRFPTVYNKAGNPDEDDDDIGKDVADPTNLLSTSNVDTVDQLEDDKASSAKSSKTTEVSNKK